LSRGYGALRSDLRLLGGFGALLLPSCVVRLEDFIVFMMFDGALLYAWWLWMPGGVACLGASFSRDCLDSEPRPLSFLLFLRSQDSWCIGVELGSFCARTLGFFGGVGCYDAVAGLFLSPATAASLLGSRRTAGA
jgi:hypothetical protein